MSPILVRPVREQLEHDRVIRLLQQDLAKKKVDVGINPGAEQNASVGGAGRKEFPDAVLYSTEKGRKLIGVVEVETAESVNYLEAMSQWALLAKLRVPFHLYVPTGSADAARRLSDDHRISVTEIWSYHQVGEQFKFTLIYPPARGRSAATAPRMVSVASIRVEPRVDPTVLEIQEDAATRSAQTRSVAPVKPQPVKAVPPIKSIPAARAPVAATKPPSEPASPRVIPVRPRVIPAKTAAAVPVAKPAAAKPVPGKSLPVPPAKAAPTAAKTAKSPAKAVAAPAPKVAPSKLTPAKLTPAKVSPAKVSPGKVVAAKVGAVKVGGVKAETSASRAASRPPAKRPPAAPRKAAPVRNAASRPPTAARASKTKLASGRKPAPKRR